METYLNVCKLLENLDRYKFLLTEGEQVKFEYNNNESIFVVTDQKIICINKNSLYLNNYVIVPLSKITGLFLQVNADTMKCDLNFIIPGIEKASISLFISKENLEELIKFLNNKIGFTDIPRLIGLAIENHQFKENPSLEDILSLKQWTEEYLERIKI